MVLGSAVDQLPIIGSYAVGPLTGNTFALVIGLLDVTTRSAPDRDACPGCGRRGGAGTGRRRDNRPTVGGPPEVTEEPVSPAETPENTQAEQGKPAVDEEQEPTLPLRIPDASE